MSEQDTTSGNPIGGPLTEAEAAAKAEAERRAGDRDRRQRAGPAPGGVDRRWSDRRRARSVEGRERYLDMVQRERAMFIEQGVSRSTEQLLDMAGATGTSELEEEEGIRDRATGDQLRSVLPVQAWLPLSIHLIGLRDGVMKIAPLNDLNQRQIDALISTATRSGFRIDKVEVEMWDRAELLETLRSVHDLSADRCEKTLAQWLSDTDNGLLLNQFQRDMLAEALQMRASDIHLVQDGAADAPNSWTCPISWPSTWEEPVRISLLL